MFNEDMIDDSFEQKPHRVIVVPSSSSSAKRKVFAAANGMLQVDDHDEDGAPMDEDTEDDRSDVATQADSIEAGQCMLDEEQRRIHYRSSSPPSPSSS